MKAEPYLSPGDGDKGWVERFLEVSASEMPPETLLSLEVSVRIGRLTARIQAENSAAGNGLSPADMDLLAALAMQGAPYRARPSTLATWAGVTNGTMTVRIDRLQKRGMVRRSIDKEDRRIRWITLTKAGLACVKDQARLTLERPLFEAIQSLPDKDKKSLTRILRRLG